MPLVLLLWRVVTRTTQLTRILKPNSWRQDDPHNENTRVEQSVSADILPRLFAYQTDESQQELNSKEHARCNRHDSELIRNIGSIMYNGSTVTADTVHGAIWKTLHAAISLVMELTQVVDVACEPQGKENKCTTV